MKLKQVSCEGTRNNKIWELVATRDGQQKTKNKLLFLGELPENP